MFAFSKASSRIKVTGPTLLKMPVLFARAGASETITYVSQGLKIFSLICMNCIVSVISPVITARSVKFSI